MRPHFERLKAWLDGHCKLVVASTVLFDCQSEPDKYLVAFILGCCLIAGILDLALLPMVTLAFVSRMNHEGVGTNPVLGTGCLAYNFAWCLPYGAKASFRHLLEISRASADAKIV